MHWQVERASSVSRLASGTSSLDVEVDRIGRSCCPFARRVVCSPSLWLVDSPEGSFAEGQVADASSVGTVFRDVCPSPEPGLAPWDFSENKGRTNQDQGPVFLTILGP